MWNGNQQTANINTTTIIILTTCVKERFLYLTNEKKKWNEMRKHFKLYIACLSGAARMYECVVCRQNIFISRYTKKKKKCKENIENNTRTSRGAFACIYTQHNQKICERVRESLIDLYTFSVCILWISKIYIFSLCVASQMYREN